MVKPTVISLFAGCGGSSLGYKYAGFKELLAIEWDDNAVKTFKLNFSNVPIWQKDIKEITGYYNVPQSRQRVIFIGVRKDLGIEPSYPEGNKKLIKFIDAIKGLKEYTDKPLPEILIKIGKKQPKNIWSSNPKIYKTIKGNLAGSFSTKWASFNNVLMTIPKSEISITGIIHPNRKRYLNLSELKRCASFPDDFKFTDRKNGCNRIGNSVPPLFMKAIAEHIRINILEKAVMLNG